MYLMLSLGDCSGVAAKIPMETVKVDVDEQRYFIIQVYGSIVNVWRMVVTFGGIVSSKAVGKMIKSIGLQFSIFKYFSEFVQDRNKCVNTFSSWTVMVGVATQLLDDDILGSSRDMKR